MDGMELMRKAKELDPELPVILITGFAEVQGAVEAIRAGAHDYLAKPFDHHQVIRVVLRALERAAAEAGAEALGGSRPPCSSHRARRFGPSEAIGRVISAIERVAKSNFSVLIVGETGSGKEVVARAIHQASVARGSHSSPWIAARFPRRCLRANCSDTSGGPSPARISRPWER